MGYTLEQNTFIVMSYYRNGTLNADGEWVYSVQACKDEYLAKFPELNIEEQSLMTHIKRIVDRFNSTGNVSKGKSPGRPPVSEEVVEDLRERMEQSPKKSLSKLSLQSGVPYTTSFVDNDLIMNNEVFDEMEEFECFDVQGTSLAPWTAYAHIKIKLPGGEDSEIFRNQEDYIFINVQAICDERIKFQILWHNDQ
ncbi:hypothetical protein Zmor_006424 [Zophobas morio]|uniref:Uncharacterized protein n=1 Tax=Zophobas morio TaxID=2755281 RepID=A0AA38ISA6_9CUCU|nr:hypothetical protein Zmor_006424 [Zophobas morio]